jgi:hypothetical protein
MDPITLILTALATGAAAAAQDTVNTAIKDAYATLKSCIIQKFTGKPEAEVALAQHEHDPDTWEKPLKKALSNVQADREPQIMEAAKKLMALAQAEGRTGGTNVTASGERSVAFGGGMSGGTITTGDTNKPQEDKA